jgi:hypothetical protein
VTFYKLIFPVWFFKSMTSTFGLAHDQRVIITFLWNEKADGRDIAAELQA